MYYCARAFLPLLIASGDGVLVNTSSVNGLWAALGPGMPNTAYCAAKFAVRGFTEALIEDLRTNAPQVRVAVVMPGHVGTDILGNTLRAHGKDPEQMTEAQLTEMIPADARAGLAAAGLLAEDASAEDLRQMTDPDEPRLPGQGAGQRGPGGDGHPRRGALRDLADPRRPGRHDDRRTDPRQA